MDIQVVSHNVPLRVRDHIRQIWTPKLKVLENRIARFGGDNARMCYNKEGDFAKIKKEKGNTALGRRAMKLGHHSVMAHAQITFALNGIPKILAMILNNGGIYQTSEKSGRFAELENLPGLQGELYCKWLDIFKELIPKVHPEVKGRELRTRSQENARYMASVFTSTAMTHTLDFRQLNYVMHDFILDVANLPSNTFYDGVKDAMIEFNKILQGLFVNELFFEGSKGTNLFAKRRKFGEEFGETYSICYLASLACLAQMQRHRTVNYEIQPIDNLWIERVLDENLFFLPLIFQGDSKIEEEWYSDLKKVVLEGDFPQGMFVDVHEYGGYKEFLMKCKERLCGHVQLETMLNVRDTLEKYWSGLKKQYTTSEIFSDFVGYMQGPKCKHPNLRCRESCVFGPDLALERLI